MAHIIILAGSSLLKIKEVKTENDTHTIGLFLVISFDSSYLTLYFERQWSIVSRCLIIL